MKLPTAWSSQWISSLTVACLFAAALLRSILAYRDATTIAIAIGLQMIWLILFAGETALSRRWQWYFPIYLVLQTFLVLTLLFMPHPADYFAVLFFILSMQIVHHFNNRSATIWIGAFTLLMSIPLANDYGIFKGIAFALIYTAGNALLASYALATRRAQQARTQNQELARQAQETNRRLRDYSTQRERLVAVRERQRLARELHDSVTQTIFSMTLTTQSALLLLERDPGRVGAQLARLNQLAQSALSEIRTLISQLRPAQIGEPGLEPKLRQHLAERHLPENLAVALEVEGTQALTPAEEQVIFRIVQEAVNNIVKHAQASHAWIRLHRAEPFWIEIEDDGCGFDQSQVQTSGRVGLASMRERAAEIGWSLRINTSPGAGTRVRVEKG